MIVTFPLRDTRVADEIRGVRVQSQAPANLALQSIEQVLRGKRDAPAAADSPAADPGKRAKRTPATD